MVEATCQFESEFTEMHPARNLMDVWNNFDPTAIVNPQSELYVPRSEAALNKLTFNLIQAKGPFHGFLCGHRGSGKTTELHRLCMNKDILSKFLPLYLTAREFGSEVVNLSHDAVMVEIGRRLSAFEWIDKGLKDVLSDWGLQIVKTFLKDEKAQVEAGAKANAWFAYFKAQLSTRNEWKYEEKQILAPKVQDLIGILDNMAQDLKNNTGRQLLVIVDDLEKGDSDAHKDMHARLFQENYDTLVQPNFSIVYTLPIYFRAMGGRRILNDQLFAFPAARLYRRSHRDRENPPLDKKSPGHALMWGFVAKRIKDTKQIFADDNALAELIKIGGGLFRETARAIQEAAYLAMGRNAKRIEKIDAKNVFQQVKKEYQPMIRGEAIEILAEVDQTGRWAVGVEPFLQSRAVVEYENDDLWIDLRYILKAYVRAISVAGRPNSA